MNKWEEAIICVISFTLANFLYQALGSLEWNIALERSFFQAIAVFSFAWLWGKEE